MGRRLKRGTKTTKKVAAKLGAEDYLSDLRATKGVEKDDYAMLADEILSTKVTDFISTGCLAIDRLLGGGWPVGRISELAAWEGVGKSTLLDQSIAHHQRQGGIACLIDTEAARDEDYSASLGVDPKKLIVHDAETIEEVFAGIDRVLDVQEAKIAEAERAGEKPPRLLIVWDSLGGTPSAAEKDGSPDDKHVSTAARVVKMNLRRVLLRIGKLNTAFVFANHFYQGIGPFASLNTYGGSGVKYFTSIRLWVSARGKLKAGANEVGHIVEAKLKKTRIRKPRDPAQAALIYGAGIDNSYTLFEWGKQHQHDFGPWVSQAGAWCYYHPPDGAEPLKFQQTFYGFGKLLSDNPDIYNAIAAAFVEEDSRDA